MVDEADATTAASMARPSSGWPPARRSCSGQRRRALRRWSN